MAAPEKPTPISEDDVDTSHVEGDRSHLLQRIQMPDVYVILVSIMLLAAAATWIVPAGTFDVAPGPDGRESIDPESYHRIPQTPVGLIEILTAIPRGIVAAAEVVVFTLIIGGTFMVLRATGIIEIGIGNLAHRLSSRGVVAIPILMVVFALIATVIGTQELALVYVPVLIPLLIALRFDSMTAAGVALCATTAGFATGVLNPINTGLGQKIAGLPLFSGMGLRAVAWLLITSFAIFMVMRYARKVRNDPAASLVADEPSELRKRETYADIGSVEPVSLNGRQRVASFAILACVVVLIWGVTSQGWFMMEMSGLFLLMAVLVGTIAGLNLNAVCASFNVGLREVLVGAFIAGVARSVAVVLEDGNILHTIVDALGSLVGGFPAWLAAIGMFAVQFVLSFIVSSGSGQALVTMPIMAPLSDLLDVSRQTSVLAYQLADGTGNILFPTSGYFMAVLALAGVPWQRWLKFYLPIFGGWLVISLGLLTYAQLTGWT